jgi:hypothetical protein
VKQLIKKCDDITYSKIINGDLIFDCLIRLPQIAEGFSNFINNIPSLKRISKTSFYKNPFALINECPNEFLDETLKSEREDNFIELLFKFRKRISKRKTTQKNLKEKNDHQLLISKQFKETFNKIICSIREAFLKLLAKLNQLLNNWNVIKSKIRGLMIFDFDSVPIIKN